MNQELDWMAGTVPTWHRVSAHRTRIGFIADAYIGQHGPVRTYRLGRPHRPC